MNNSTIQTDSALLDFARRYTRNQTISQTISQTERRMAPREFFVEPITLRLVNQEQGHAESPVRCVTYDYSDDGLGVITPDRLSMGNYRGSIHLKDRDVELVLRVVWGQASGPYYRFGGPIVKMYD